MLLKLFISLFCVFGIANLALCKEVCYGDLGCFTNSYPFSGTLGRPIAYLPESPDKVDTSFNLFNRKIREGERIKADNLTGTNFDPSLHTKFITHGFLENGLFSWMIELKELLLDIEDVNVILVDWGKGRKRMKKMPK